MRFFFVLYKSNYFLTGILILILSVTFFTGKAYGAQTDAMFVTEPVWFSQEPVAGNSVSIITALYNNNEAAISGTVSFYDYEILLGKTSISIPPKSARNASIFWKVTAGDHRIRAELSNGKTIEGGTTVSVAAITTPEIHEVVTAPSPIIPKKTTTDNPQTVKQLEAIADLESKVTAAIPEGVRTTAAAIDVWREEKGVVISSWKEKAQKEVDALKITTDTTKKTTKEEINKGSDSTVLPSAFAYVKLFLATIGSFIVSSSIAFYGVIIVIILFIGRLILRKFLPD